MNRSRGQVRFDVNELVGDFGAFLGVTIDGSNRVENGRVVPAAKVAADFFQRVARVLARQVHADLSRKRDGLVSLFALEIRQADVVVAGDLIEDLLDGDPALLTGGGIAE